MAEERTTHCPTCDLTYFYDPRNHDCAEHARSKELQAFMPRTTWAEECVAKVMAPRPPRRIHATDHGG